MRERDEDEHRGSKGKNKSPMPTVSHASKYQESVNNKQITYSSIYTRSKLQSNITDNRNNNKAATAAATTHTHTNTPRIFRSRSLSVAPLAHTKEHNLYNNKIWRIMVTKFNV